jgi:hypothetical protein
MQIACHIGVRHSDGTYTTIGSATATGAGTGGGIVFAAGTAQTLTLPTITGALTNFVVGDRLVVDFDANVTVATSSTTATISLFMNAGANESVVTPGYQPTPAVVSGWGQLPI